MSGSISPLPTGYVLNEYRVESVLGVGGFGVTYLATDVNLNLKVALKEYLPVNSAMRAADHAVSARAPADSEAFDWGLRRFLDEARTLASFRHSNIVRVMRFFEGNHTGYMVMEFVEGEPLTAWIDTRRPLPQQDVLDLVVPLLGGLAVIHKASYLHRDIKPANVFMRADDSPVLLDFGSARELTGGNQELTAMVSPGYAPFEQYYADGKQGPWSDLYALGGVMYWMITGAKPVDATARIRKDTMTPASAQLSSALYTAEFLGAIDWALKPNEEERPQSIADFLARLGIATPDISARRSGPPSASPRTGVDPPTQVAQLTKSGLTTVAVMGGFDPQVLKRIETEAALHVGPIAPVIVRNAARKSTTVSELCGIVAQDIEDDKARAAFLKKFANEDRHAANTAPPAMQPQTQSTAAAQSQPASSRFSPDELKRAESELARHIGAVAGVVVKRAAAKARDEVELYLLIADEIQDPVEKKAFVRKAVIASRTR